ncbi:glycosyltransferase family 4 protein [bacterium]|nr:glycosyltransferase family 4 protein [bacterium]
MVVRNGKKSNSALTTRKKKLRIAQIHWAFLPVIGGVETHLTILMPELIKNGHKISLLTGSLRDSPEEEDYFGVRVQRSPYMSLDYLLQHDAELLQKEIEKTLANFIARFKPDVVHAHNLHYFTFIHAQVLSRLCREKGIPLILTAHNAWNDIQFLKLSRDIAWDHIIAVSHFIKREMLSVGCLEEKVTVIHHGLDVDLFKPGINPESILTRFPQMRNKRIVFHPARLGLAKGSDVVVKAFRRVREKFRDALLVLAGSNNIVDWEQTQKKDITYILDLIKYFGLKKNVLIDSFHLSEMPSLYSVSQVVVYPSSGPEPFGLTLLESIAMAKPMIVSNMGGMPEIIREGICGYVVPVHDSETLAARIQQLLGDDKLRQRMGLNGRALVSDHFSKSLMCRNHEGVYYQAVAEKKAVGI